MRKLVNNWNKLDHFTKEKIGEILSMLLLGVYATYILILQS